MIVFVFVWILAVWMYSVCMFVSLAVCTYAPGTGFHWDLEICPEIPLGMV